MNNDSTQHEHSFSDEAGPDEGAQQVQLFGVRALSFGVAQTEIATIAEWREPTPLPHAPESVLGVVSIHGRMLTLLDLATLNGSENTSDDESYRHIIALRGDEQLALAVSELYEILDFPNSNAGGPAGNDEKFVVGVLERNGLKTKILKVTELFPAALQGRERRRRRF